MLRALLLVLLLAACSSPADNQSAYPQNPAISDAQGYPRDSSTLYFPAADSSYIDSITAHTTSTPPHELLLASCNLWHFGAPVLSNYYLGANRYRFLWLRSFSRPVLLTLTQRATGAILRTQFLDKPACSPQLSAILFIPPGTSATQERKLQQEFQKRQADPAMQQARARVNRPPIQLVALETTHPVSPAQWGRFAQLLQNSAFQQLPTYEESMTLDGAYWLLEAHKASGYHAVFRHSPEKQDNFRRACEYLLDLSSARKEDR
ncbi:hypothetical protein [Hymenobacter sp. UYP22]|uniref:hypothetical protein n=1 Tax=Hymenobacter sp. UYP22 TaxID=3156348 RepID=UPI00339794E0